LRQEAIANLNKLQGCSKNLFLIKERIDGLKYKQKFSNEIAQSRSSNLERTSPNIINFNSSQSTKRQFPTLSFFYRFINFFWWSVAWNPFEKGRLFCFFIFSMKTLLSKSKLVYYCTNLGRVLVTSLKNIIHCYSH